VAAARGRTITFSLRIQNDRTTTDSFWVRGAAGNTANFRVRYYAGSTEITNRVVAGTYSINALGPAATRTIQMKVTVKSTAAAGATVSRLVTITSQAETSVKDAVKATVRRS
jgi:hypothetical protein